MNKCQKIFIVFFILILVVICICIVLYRMVFNGGLSTDSNDWIAFATLVGSIGTMLFTGLNVIVFYVLTSVIEENRQLENKKKKQLELINQFNNNVEGLFHFDEDGEFVDVPSRVLKRAERWFEERKNSSSLLPTLGKKHYSDFVSAFGKFCEDYKFSVNSETWQGHSPSQRAFDLYKQALEIVSALLKDMEQTA